MDLICLGLLRICSLALAVFLLWRLIKDDLVQLVVLELTLGGDVALVQVHAFAQTEVHATVVAPRRELGSVVGKDIPNSVDYVLHGIRFEHLEEVARVDVLDLDGHHNLVGSLLLLLELGTIL